MTEQVKLCKDCKHYKGFISKYAAECYTQEALDFVDPVSGYSYSKSCAQMRLDINLCGKKARLFEPRPPGFFTRMWDKLFGKDTH